MTLVNVMPFLWPGITGSITATPGFGTHATLDAAGEYTSYVFQAQEDMVISHVGWRTGTVAGSPTADTRIETVGTDGIPTGTLWAANTNIVSGTLSSNAWTLHALTASATIARGQFFAVKVVYASGTSIIVQRIAGLPGLGANVSYTVTNTSGSAVKSASNQNALIALGSSATTFYSVLKCFPSSAVANTAFNNAAAGDKRGLRFQVPFACRSAGIVWYNSTSAGDLSAALYNDAGTELLSSGIAIEGDQSGLSGNTPMIVLFDNPVILSPGTWYRIAIEPTSATNVTVGFSTLPSVDYLSAWPHKANAHYTTFTTAGGWVDSATNQLPYMDILVDQLDDGAGAGGSGGGAHILGGTVVR